MLNAKYMRKCENSFTSVFNLPIIFILSAQFLSFQIQLKIYLKYLISVIFHFHILYFRRSKSSERVGERAWYGYPIHALPFPHETFRHKTYDSATFQIFLI